MITQKRLKQLAACEPAAGLFICAQNRKGSKNNVAGKKQIHLGTFNEPSVTAAAYQAAKQQHIPTQEG